MKDAKMKSFLMMLLIFSFMAGIARSEILGRYDFEGTSPTQAKNVAPGVVMSNLYIDYANSAGFTNETAIAGTPNVVNSTKIIRIYGNESISSTGTSMSTGKYLSFTISTPESLAMNFDSLSVDIQGYNINAYFNARLYSTVQGIDGVPYDDCITTLGASYTGSRDWATYTANLANPTLNANKGVNITANDFKGVTSVTFYMPFVQNSTSNTRWGEIDNIVISGTRDLSAYLPSPANKSVYQGTLSGGNALVTLGWKAGRDPNDIAPMNSHIRKHYIYMSKDQIKFPTDPNLYYVSAVDQVGTTNPVNAYGPMTLNADGRYLWSIEEGMDNGAGGTYPAGDPNNIKGRTWIFETVKAVPQVVTQPANTNVFAGQTATISVTVSSVTTPHYAWFKSPDNVNNTTGNDVPAGTDNSTLTITIAQAADEAYYYCKITNTSGTTISNTAGLGVKREVAHYKFDDATDPAGFYADTIGSHPAALVNAVYTPSYVAGVDGDAVVMNADSVANAGVWSPSLFTNEISVTCWVKWNGARGAGTYQGICGKANTLDTTNEWMWRTNENSGVLGWRNKTTTGPTLTLTNTGNWQFICITIVPGTATPYVNGIKQAVLPFSFGAITSDPLWIGAAENNVQAYFNGVIDDLRIYNYVLTQESVIDDYNAKVDPDLSLCLHQGNIKLGTDFNGDCRVNLTDFARLANNWMVCGLYPASNCN